MWNLTPDYIQQVKEELKGRRAAIQARYADELKALEADIEELETLERVAYAIAVKHLGAGAAAEPHAAIAPAPDSSAVEFSEDHPIAALQPAVLLPAVSLAADQTADHVAEHDAKGLSRWRRRLEPRTENEPA